MNEHNMQVVMLYRRTLPDGRYDTSAENEPLVRQRDAQVAIAALKVRIAELEAQAVKPIDMVLHCPACLEQHIDGPEPEHHRFPASPEPWDNPPHRSHLCRHCGHIWRPADVPTNGVLETKTHGKNDMVMFDGPAEVMRRLRAQAEFGRGQQLDPDWGA